MCVVHKHLHGVLLSLTMNLRAGVPIPDSAVDVQSTEVLIDLCEMVNKWVSRDTWGR